MNRLTSVICPLVAAAFTLHAASCALEPTPEDTWEGEELWENETVPDAERQGVDDVVSKASGWTQWYDRDDPSLTGDWELRSLQVGVCSAPTGVDCLTTSGLYLWQTGEVVSCSTDGLLCLNDDQPDGVCNYDYKVRFLCPICGDGVCEGGETSATCSQDCGCTPRTCYSWECGWVSDGCNSSMWCGACDPCGPIPLTGKQGDGSSSFCDPV